MLVAPDTPLYLCSLHWSDQHKSGLQLECVWHSTEHIVRCVIKKQVLTYSYEMQLALERSASDAAEGLARGCPALLAHSHLHRAARGFSEGDCESRETQQQGQRSERAAADGV